MSASETTNLNWLFQPIYFTVQFMCISYSSFDFFQIELQKYCFFALQRRSRTYRNVKYVEYIKFLLDLLFNLYFSDGAGRTGTYIAISNLLERMKIEQAMDVFQSIKIIRAARPQFVENAVSELF